MTALLVVVAISQTAALADKDHLETSLANEPMVIMDAGEQAGIQVGAISLNDVPAETLSRVVQNVPATKDLIVSSDSEGLLENVARVREEKGGSGLTRLVPVTVSRVARHLVNSAKADRIGLIIAVINTAYDSYVWMHAYQYSEGVRIAQTIFTTLLSITFSIDKDLWARTARKIQGRIIRLFDAAAADPVTMASAARTGAGLATSFAANFALGLSIQAGRLAILSYDKMTDIPMLVASAGGVLALTAALTFSNFGWTEFAADVDPKQNPFTKWIVRRLTEVRSFIMGNLAPSGKLLQPEVFGMGPWVALAANGAVGLAAFFGSDRLVKWSEYGTSLRFLRRPVAEFSDGSSRVFGRDMCGALFAP